MERETDGEVLKGIIKAEGYKGTAKIAAGVNKCLK